LSLSGYRVADGGAIFATAGMEAKAA